MKTQLLVISAFALLSFAGLGRAETTAAPDAAKPQALGTPQEAAQAAKPAEGGAGQAQATAKDAKHAKHPAGKSAAPAK
jgi:uncharacterized low-complexity protein